MNAVTSGDFSRPVRIGKFLKELYSGFQLLNLKNDTLRKRFDGIKVRDEILKTMMRLVKYEMGFKWVLILYSISIYLLLV